MDQLSNLFTFHIVFKIGALVFSFLFLVLTIQMFANISEVAKTVVTKRNTAFIFITGLLVVISILLFILGFVIL